MRVSNKEFGFNLERRTLKFAISVLKLSMDLPRTLESEVIRHQISKSGTSVGANYREANRARSSRDFKNRIRICLAEANETLFWTEIIDEMNWNSSLLETVHSESRELVAIFTSISSKLNKK